MAGLLAEEIEEIILALSQLECEEDKPKLPDEALKTPRGGGGGEATTARAAKKLRERNTHLIREARTLRHWRRLHRTIKVQREGGMLTADKSRRRSAGGVFFFLLRDEMDADAYRKLMNEDSKRRKRRRGGERGTHRRKQRIEDSSDDRPAGGAGLLGCSELAAPR